MFPKRKRIEDPELCAFVRQAPCLACIPGFQTLPTEPHHVTTRGAGGDDTLENLMPLCTQHHAQWHQEGPGKMIERYEPILNWLEGVERFDILERVKETAR